VRGVSSLTPEEIRRRTTVTRIETLDRLVVHTYQLDHDAGVYVASGSFGKTVKVDDPWPIAFPVQQLIPAHYLPNA
jgi:hypothetical protein